MGLIGGIVGVWVAMRTATRVAVKIVAAATDSGPALSGLERQVRLLEEWRWQSAPVQHQPPRALQADA